MANANALADAVVMALGIKVLHGLEGLALLIKVCEEMIDAEGGSVKALLDKLDVKED